MIWKVCLVLALAVFVVLNLIGIGFFIKRRKTRHPVSLVAIFIGVTFLSAFILLIPYFYEHESFIGSNARGFASIFQTIRASLQVFSLDGEYVELYVAVPALTGIWAGVYQVFSAILYVLAPILLISFIATFFQSAFIRMRLRRTRRKNIYVFSELNTSALILAASCLEHDRKEHKKSIVVFTDVYDQQEEISSELVDHARVMGAVRLKSDIANLLDRKNSDFVNFRKKKADVRFFINGSNETENIGHATRIIQAFKNYKHIHLYVITNTEEAKLMIGSAMRSDMLMEVRCIDSAQSLVYSYLNDMNPKSNVMLKRIQELSDNETEQSAVSDCAQILPNGEKILPVILVGLGRYGTEFLKALVWYTQLPDIRLQVHVFEQDPYAEEKFSSLCPELMEMNHNEIDGESHYDIFFHRSKDGAGIDAETVAFDCEIRELADAAVTYVMMGNDEKNISTAVKMRQLFTISNLEKQSQTANPAIQAVVFDPARKKIAEENSIKNYKGQEYDIGFIGDLESEWSYDRIINDRLEEEAKERHLQWSDEISFYQFEYNRKSSMSSAIRIRVRRQIGMMGADKAPEDRSDVEKKWIEKYEHTGWNAYMRSEGYRYEPERNELAKCHHDLVSFDALSEEEQEKDNV